MPFGRSRRVRTGSQTLLAMAAFAAILVFAGLLVQRFPKRVDLTSIGAQSLSEETLKVLGALHEDVRAIAFPSREGDNVDQVRDLLENYHVASRRFTYEIVDAERNLAMAKQYDIPGLDTIVLIAGTKTHNVTEPTEQAITNGLRDLLQSKERKVYFTAGHGEHPIQGTSKDAYTGVGRAIEGANFPVAPLTLINAAKIPDDAAAIVIAGPKKPFLPPEIDLLKAYVRSGGGLIVMLDPDADGGLRDLLQGWGIGLDDDLIVDKFSRLFGGDYTTPVVMQYNKNSFLSGFDVATFFPQARSVEALSPPPAGFDVKRLASTSQAAWGEKGKAELDKGVIKFQADRDIPGPVPVVVLSELPARAKKAKAGGPSAETGEAAAAESSGSESAGAAAPRGKVIVFGDSDFIADAYLGLSGNADLFLNALQFIARSANPILIQHRQREGSPLFVTAAQGRNLGLVSFVLAPGFVLLGGLLVWRFRRRHR